MLHKSTAYAVKDVDTKQGVIQAYWSSFGTVDEGRDVVDPGAFTKTLGEWGPKAAQPRTVWLYQHDSKSLLAKPSELLEDDFGLLATAQFVKTTLGNDVLLLYEAGVINEHSIGYEPVGTRIDRAAGVRHLTQLKLFEGSSVTWGMNSITPTVSVKSLQGSDTVALAIAAKVAALDDLLHHGRLQNDDLCLMLERELKAMQGALVAAGRAEEHPTQTAPYSILSTLAMLDGLTSSKSVNSGEENTAGEGGTMDEKDTTPAADTLLEETTPPAPKAAKTLRRKDTTDFATTYRTERSYYDLLEELGDGFLAFQQFAVSLLMDDSRPDKVAESETSIGQFADFLRGWLATAAESETWDDAQDRAEQEAQRGYDWAPGAYLMGRGGRLDEKSTSTPEAAPEQPITPTPVLEDLAASLKAVKAGKPISAGNRKTLTDAANGIAEQMKAASGALKTMGTHHKAITSLLEQTDPGKNDGDSSEKSTAPDRSPSGSGTTHSDVTPEAAKAALASLLTDLELPVKQ